MANKNEEIRKLMNHRPRTYKDLDKIGYIPDYFFKIRRGSGSYMDYDMGHLWEFRKKFGRWAKNTERILILAFFNDTQTPTHISKRSFIDRKNLDRYLQILVKKRYLKRKIRNKRDSTGRMRKTPVYTITEKGRAIRFARSKIS